MELIIVDSAQTPLNHGPLQQKKPRNMQVNMLLLSNKEPLTKILKLAQEMQQYKLRMRIYRTMPKKKYSMITSNLHKYLIPELGMNKVITLNIMNILSDFI